MPRSLEARGPRAGASLGDSVVEGGRSSQGHALCRHPRGDPAHFQQPNLGVPEGSLAGFWGRHEKALELVCGAVFLWKLTCGAGPGDLGASPGVGCGRQAQENRAEHLRPDCLQLPRLKVGGLLRGAREAHTPEETQPNFNHLST